MPKPVILVVDDEDAARQVCHEALELDGYEVVTASGTNEAVEVLASRDVDAVVCDVQMPHNGMRLYEFLLYRFPDLAGRFIFVTGSPVKKAEVEKLPKKAACILKPFSLALLLDTLRTALR